MVESDNSGLSELPTFPTLAKLDLGHLSGIRKFTSQFDDYSDFNATSLWSWSSSTPQGYSVARLGDNLIVEFSDYLSGVRFMSFLGVDSVDDVAMTLSDHARCADLQRGLHLIPAVTAGRLSPARWLIQDDLDSSDYIYDLAQMKGLHGAPYRSVRRSLHRFERRWLPSTKVEWMAAGDLPGVVDDVLDLFDSWHGRGSQGAVSSAPERTRPRPVTPNGASRGSATLGLVCTVLRGRYPHRGLARRSILIVVIVRPFSEGRQL